MLLLSSADAVMKYGSRTAVPTCGRVDFSRKRNDTTARKGRRYPYRYRAIRKAVGDVMLRQITAPDGKLLTGEFGLERETLRVTQDGHMAHTPHPFPNDPNIVKDFCENQTEINTGVHTSAEAVIDELDAHTE